MASSSKAHMASYPPQHQIHDAKFNAMTLYASFGEDLLILAPPPVYLPKPAIDLSKHGSSTRNAAVPIVWFSRTEIDYIQQALQAINMPQVQVELRSSYLPAPYDPCVLNTETDIVQASVLWLLHPVIKALQASFPQVKCAAEVSFGDCRCDALISIQDCPVVVIEYKNRGNIRWTDFAPGLVRDYSVSNHTTIRKQINAGRDIDRQSYMEHNAVCLTKQTAAYATKWQTRYAVLFDWDNMFLWNFAGMDFQPSVNTASAGARSRGRPPASAPSQGARHAEWAYGTMVQERKDYRSTLLGFIIEAYSNKSSAGFRQGKLAPFEFTPSQKQKQKLQQDAQRQQQMTPQEKANRNLYQGLRR